MENLNKIKEQFREELKFLNIRLNESSTVVNARSCYGAYVEAILKYDRITGQQFNIEYWIVDGKIRNEPKTFFSVNIQIVFDNFAFKFIMHRF